MMEFFTPLEQRLAAAAVALRPVDSRYRVIFDDPEAIDAPVQVLIPAPEWVAAALHGGILPPIEAYLRDAATYAAFCARNDPRTFSWLAFGGAEHWTADPIGPMTEEEAIQYLILKDIPAHILAPRNRPHHFIVRREEVSADRTFRDAWVLDDGYVRVDMSKARKIHRERLADLEEKRQADERRSALVSAIGGEAVDAATTPEQLAALLPAAAAM